MKFKYQALSQSQTVFFLLAFFFVTFLNFGLVSKPGIAQTEIPDTITIGVRTVANAIGNKKESGSWGGFCGFFGKELQVELAKNNSQTKVHLIDIENQFINRYYGLKINKIQIECGPNTIVTDEKILQNKGWEHITFSEPFHRTGIKVLLKQETLSILGNNSQNISQESLNSIRIGVVHNTTTYEQLENTSYNLSKFDTRKEGLKALEEDKIQGFAGDVLALKNILEQDYQYENYILFPEEKGQYLPKTFPEYYGMAISNNSSYTPILLNSINQTLKLAKIKKYQQKLINEENGKTNQQLIEEKDKYIDEISQELFDSNQSLIKMKRNTISKIIYLVSIVVVAILTAAITIFFRR